jgi:hypothetical protein
MNVSLAIVGFLLAQPSTELHFRPAGKDRIDIVAPLNASQRKVIPAGALTGEQGEAWLRLCIVDPESKKVGPTMFGAYERDADALIFRPRFGVEPGKTYRAFFGPALGPVVTKDYHVALRNSGKLATVSKIYPTDDVLPANLLRFTIYFSQPMRGGKDIFNQIQILDAQGNVLPDIWLTDEIWDETGQILIIYIHPGRIKWGLVLREVLGPVLYPDRDYTFVIRGTMVDSNGQMLGKDVTKKFRTTAEDRVRVELSDWKVQSPMAGAPGSVTVQFPKSVDHRGLENSLTIVDAKGDTVAGAVQIGKAEKSWTFAPTRPLSNQEYRLKVNGQLEDVAGNSPLRPFDLDLSAPAPREQSLEIPFRPRN